MSTERQLRTESYMKQKIIKTTKGMIHKSGKGLIPKYHERKETHKKISIDQN